MVNELIISENIRNKIYAIRGVQVMLDSDLARLYEVSTKRLNEQVKRNKDKFPVDFMFQLTASFQSYTSSIKTGSCILLF